MLGRGFLIVALLGQIGHAQPAPTPPPAAAPSPQAPWYRFTLLDGRFIDAQLVGGDAQSYFIQTSAGVYSLARVNVRAAVAFAAPSYPAPVAPMAPAFPPPAPATPPAPTFESDKQDDSPKVSRTQAGIMIFALAYVPTTLVAYGRGDEDPDHGLGYIPLIGPIAWTASDEGKWGEDGYDWIAALSSVIQLGGIAMFAQGLASPGPAFDKKRAKNGVLALTPIGTRDYAGLSVSGAF